MRSASTPSRTSSSRTAVARRSERRWFASREPRSSVKPSISILRSGCSSMKRARFATARLDRSLADVEEQVAGERQDPAALGFARLQLRHLHLQAPQLRGQAIVHIALLLRLAEPRLRALALGKARMPGFARDARALLGEMGAVGALARRGALGL